MLFRSLYIMLSCLNNSREWVTVAIIPFGLYYLASLTKEHTRSTIDNIMNGILVSFIGITIFCLLHRPFHYYMYTRYPWYFHTVTVTAMYFMIVFAVTLAKVYEAYRSKQTSRIICSLCFFGTVLTFCIFTISITFVILSPLLLISFFFVCLFFYNNMTWMVLLNSF